MTSIFDRMNEGVWKTADGRVMTPEQMDANHRRNVLAIIRRNAVHLHDAYTWRACFLEGPDPDTAAHDLFDREFEVLLNRDPDEWIEEFPLVRRLMELVGE